MYNMIPLLLFFLFVCGQVLCAPLTHKYNFFSLSTDSSTSHTTQWIELANSHRNNSALKLSLGGVTVNEVIESITKESVQLHLGDGSNVTIGRRLLAGVDEYQFAWYGGGPNGETRELCFHYGFGNASWYNTYQSLNQRWPMDTTKRMPKRHFNYLLDFESDPQKVEFYEILEHLFITSDGFALLLDEHAPSFLRLDPNNGDPLLCVSVNNTYPYQLSDRLRSYFDIKFTLLSSANVRQVYDAVVDKVGLIRSPVGIPDEELFTYPTWSTKGIFGQIDSFNETHVYEYARDIKLKGFPASYIELHRDWEKHYGDLAFSKEHFPSGAKMVSNIRDQLGQKMMLWFYPDIDYNSTMFEEGLRYCIKDGQRRPLLLTYGHSIRIYVDFSNYEASEWFLDRLTGFMKENRVDAFNFLVDGLTWNRVPYDPIAQRHPSLLSKEYCEQVSKLGNNMVLNSAFKTQHLPNFLQINSRTSDWSQTSGLKSIIPTVLSLSIGGYSYLIPNIIGGTIGNSSVSEELYIRWVQLAALMPSMKLSIPPWHYTEHCVNITRKMINLHAQFAPEIIRLAKERVKHGGPIVRPLWYAFPEDAHTFKIANQFMLGEAILVAPVVNEGQKERMVYFPTGAWVDQHGKSFQGPGDVKVLAPIDELPYFKRHI